MNENSKTIAIISYITLIGWVVAIIMHNNEKEKSEFALFHIRQSLGLMLTFIAVPIASLVIAFIPFINMLFAFVSVIVYIGVLILWILGLVAAVNNETKEVPLLGALYQKYLKDIK